VTGGEIRARGRNPGRGAKIWVRGRNPGRGAKSGVPGPKTRNWPKTENYRFRPNWPFFTLKTRIFFGFFGVSLSPRGFSAKTGEIGPNRLGIVRENGKFTEIGARNPEIWPNFPKSGENLEIRAKSGPGAEIRAQDPKNPGFGSEILKFREFIKASNWKPTDFPQKQAVRAKLANFIKARSANLQSHEQKGAGGPKFPIFSYLQDTPRESQKNGKFGSENVENRRAVVFRIAPVRVR